MNSEETSKWRIHVLCESDANGDPHGASHIRLLRPLSHPSVADRVVLTSGLSLPDFAINLVIVERLWFLGSDLQAQRELLERLRERAIPLLFCIDDNLLDLNSAPGSPNFPTPQQRQMILRFVSKSLGIISSTEPLADRLRGINPNVVVIPNSLDERLFLPRVDPVGASKVPLCLGYMGTFSHLDDLLMVAQPLRRFLAKMDGRVRMELVGVASAAVLKDLFGPLPVSVLPVPLEKVRYPQFTQWMSENLRWDFAIAPLGRSAFNDCKSDLKFLDYGAFGIPGIFSNSPSYANTVKHHRTGLLASDDPLEWEAQLDLMAEQHELRRQLGDAAEGYVRQERMLDRNAVMWLDAIDSMMAGAKKWMEAHYADGDAAVPVSAAEPVPQERNARILRLIDTQGLGLEIGPSFSPVLAKSMGFNVHTLDHAPKDELIAKYKNQGVDVTRIEDVDFVWRGEPLDELVGGADRYDYLIASHVVEHTPDLISFLQQCERILRPGGILSLVVPDRRYCFDTFRSATSTGDVLQAHFEKRKLHTAGTVFDHYASQVFMGQQVSWSAQDQGALSFSVDFSQAVAMMEQAKLQSEYLDVHNWRFTPSSFRLIVDDLVRLRFLNLSVDLEYPTHGCEFYISLVKQTDAAKVQDRFFTATKAAAEAKIS